MIALGKRPGLICKGAQPVDVYVGGHPVTPGITLEDYPLQEASGSVVTIEPLTGYKLGVTSHITAVQEGTGDPAPDNVRPIVGWDSVTLTHNSQTHTRALPETVYGGTLDWRTGLLTVNQYSHVFTGQENIKLAYIGGYVRYQYEDNVPNTITYKGKCSQYKYSTAPFANNVTDNAIFVRKGIYWRDDSKTTVDEMKVWMADQYAAGTPVTVTADIAPYTIQLTPQQLIALAGINTIHSTSGDTTATYRIRKI